MDKREVVITLKAEKTEDNSLNTALKVSDDKGNDVGAYGKSAYAALAIAAAEEAFNEVIAWADFQIDRTLILNDDYIGERNKNIALHYINGASSAITTIGSYTAMGASAGGWVGAIIGAVIGTATVAAKNIRSNVTNARQQELQVTQMNYQLEFTRMRSGWSTHAASLGDNL